VVACGAKEHQAQGLMGGGTSSSSTERGFLGSCRSSCGSAVFLDAPVVNAVLMVAVVVCSGAIAWYEFRLNPMADTERGEWTGRQLFYALTFTITFFVAFLYVLTVVF
jgi:hypothetical protein